MENEEKRAWLYCRCASAKDVAWTLDCQEQRLRKYCEEKGIQIVGISRIHGSGMRMTEEFIEPALSAAKSGQANLLVMTSVDRLGRKGAVVNAVLLRLERFGMTAVTLSRGVIEPYFRPEYPNEQQMRL